MQTETAGAAASHSKPAHGPPTQHGSRVSKRPVRLADEKAMACTSHYKAAGVLCVRSRGRGMTEVLLSIERRPQEPGDAVFHLLGGRAEYHDRGNPLLTAAREFHEEIGGSRVSGLTRDDVHALLSQSSVQRLWVPRGKFVLYVVAVNAGTIFDELPARYAKGFVAHKLGAHSEANALAWVQWHDLTSAAQSAKHLLVLGAIKHPLSEFLTELAQCGDLTEALRDAIAAHLRPSRRR